jgi:hypothetical protein
MSGIALAIPAPTPTSVPLPTSVRLREGEHARPRLHLGLRKSRDGVGSPGVTPWTKMRSLRIDAQMSTWLYGP